MATIVDDKKLIPFSMLEKRRQVNCELCVCMLLWDLPSHSAEVVLAFENVVKGVDVK